MKRVVNCITALALSLSMVFSLSCNGLIIFAEDFFSGNDKETINYVSLGDSMSNGYGLPGYDGNTGVQDYAHAAYPNLLADWMEKRYHVPVNHAQLAMSMMRVEDLHWMLEFDFSDKAVATTEMVSWDKAAWRACFPATGDYQTWHSLCNNKKYATAAAYIEAYAKGNAQLKDILENPENPNYDPEYKLTHEEIRIVADYYQQSVRNADVITMSIGNGNFGDFMTERMMDAMGALDGDPTITEHYDYQEVLQHCDSDLRSRIELLLPLMDLVANELVSGTDLSQEQVTRLKNVVKYTVVSYLVNYVGTIEAILALNPDATVVVVSLMNALPRSEVGTTEEATIGDIYELLYGPMNMFVANWPAYRQTQGHSAYQNATFYYAEAEYIECMVEIFGDDFYIDQNGKKISNRNSVSRKRFVRDIIGSAEEPGLVWNILKDTQLVEGLPLVPVTFTEVCEYDDMSDEQKVKYSLVESQKANSIAVYLAMEKTILQAVDKNEPVTLSSLMGLAEMDASMFGGVISDFRANVMDYTEPYQKDTAKAVAEKLSMSVDKVLSSYANPSAKDHAKVKPMMDSALIQLAIPEVLSACTMKNASVTGLLSVFARCIIGDGIGGHPSPQGHHSQYQAIVDVLKAGKQDNAFQHVYRVDETSSYLALGDAKVFGAASDGFARKLQEAAEDGVGYTNLMVSDQTAADLLSRLPEYTQQIQEADIISLGFSTNTMNQFLVSQLKAMLAHKAPAAMDWHTLLGEEYAALIKPFIEDIKLQIAGSMSGGNVMGLDIGEVMTVAVESYAYCYVEHMFSYYQLCTMIHSINPEVQILTVGAYNPLEGVVLNMDGNQFDMGEYMGMLTSLTNFVYLCAGASTETCTYVMLPETKSAAKATYEVVPFVMDLLRNGANKYDPDPKTYAQVEEALWKAVTVTKYVGPSSITSDIYSIGAATVSKIASGTTVEQFLKGLSEADYVKVYQNGAEVASGKNLGTGMELRLEVGGQTVQSLTVVVTGDSNGDGAITVTDMLAVKSHVLNKTKLSGVSLTAGDTNGDGAITVTDFIQIKAQILGKGNVVPR